MREISSLVQDIRDALVFGVHQAPNKALAEAYVQVREMAAARLAAVAAALRAGDEYRALQLAEIEPRLPNFIAHISFPEEAQWAELCRAHQLPVPSPLDNATIQHLQRLYMRGITTDSPFYQDCRAAIAAGDEERALQLIRSIVRLNPTDGDARQEMNRRLQLKLTPQLAALRSALERRDAEMVLRQLDEIERSGLDSVLAHNEVYQAAVNARTAITQYRAAARVEELLHSSEAQQNQAGWEVVGAGIRGIRKLERDHRLTFPPEQTARLSRLEAYVEQQRLAAAKQAEMEVALVSFRALANRIHARLESTGVLSVADAEKLQGSLAKAWEVVEEFHLPVPESDLIRFDEMTAEIQAKLHARRRAMRVKRLVTLIPAALIFLAALWGCYVYASAQRYFQQLEELHRNRMAGAARHLILSITSSALWGINSVPFLKAKMEEVGQWSTVQVELLSQTEVKLDEIQAWVDNNLEQVTPEELMRKLTEAADDVDHLAADYIQFPQQRLATMRAQIKERFRALRAANTEKVRTQLAPLHRLADDLDFNRPTAELAATMATLDSRFQEIAKCEHPTIPELRLPDDVSASLTELRSRTQSFAAELATLNAAKSAMASADGLEAYKTNLQSYAKLRFAEVREAAGILQQFPTPADIAATLLFHGDADAWQQAQQQVAAGYQLLPDDVVIDELTRIGEIRSHPVLQTTVALRKLLAAARLDELADPAGGRYTMSLMQAVDAVVASAPSDLVAKAYLVRNLFAVMQARRFPWGLHYCAPLTADMAELDALLGEADWRGGDWKLAGSQPKLAANLKTFFASIAAHQPYFELAQGHYAIVSHVVRSGIHYVGFVDEAQEVHLRVKEPAAKEMIGIAEVSGNPMAVAFENGTPRPEHVQALRKWSPLFMFASGLQEQPVAGHAAPGVPAAASAPGVAGAGETRQPGTSESAGTAVEGKRPAGQPKLPAKGGAGSQ